MFLTRPAKFLGAKKGIEEFERAYGGTTPDETLIPDWMSENLPVRVRYLGGDRYEYWLMGSWLPAADLVRLLEPTSLIGGMLTPILKLPYEYAFNYSLLFEEPIERYPRETQSFLGLQLRGRDVHALRSIRLLNMFDKFAFKPDLPWQLRVAPAFLGRSYPVDFQDRAKFELYRMNREIGAIEASIRREEKKALEVSRGQGLKPGERRTRTLLIERNVSILKDELREMERRRERLR
jgi:hypothetical protein